MATTFLKTIKNSVKNWYVPVIVGFLFIVLGFYVFSTPTTAFLSLVLLFTFSFLITGILEVFFAISNKDELEGWGWHLASGVFSSIVGIVLLMSPSLAAATLALFLGFTVLFRSFQGFGHAFEIRHYGVKNWWALLLTSGIGIILAFLLIANPVFASLSLVYLTAFSLIFSGISAIIFGFQLRRLKNMPDSWKQKINSIQEEYYRAQNQ